MNEDTSRMADNPPPPEAAAPSSGAIAEAARALRDARRVVVFTGAGMSADSGIATFRDARASSPGRPQDDASPSGDGDGHRPSPGGRGSGLWAQFDPQALATPEGFDADPPLVWGWYEARRLQVRQAQPNAGHHAVARMLRDRPGWQVVTQNVDDLHERAAAAAAVAPGRTVVHLHGSLFAARCRDCSRPFALPGHAAGTPEGGDGAEGRLAPPRCSACGGPVRPGVVWFGEALPHDAWSQAAHAVDDADAMLVVGTSGVVQPAAGLVTRALQAGARVWVVDPDGSAAVQHLRLRLLRGRAAEVLPRLADVMDR
jgi:NAD-dependent deacetylase